MNISEMGGGTPIGMLRKDVVDQQAKQMNQNLEQQHIRQYMDNRNIDVDDQRQKDEDAIDALINQINTESDESKPKKKKSKTNGKSKSKKSKDTDTDTDTDTDDNKKSVKVEKKSKFKLPFKIPEFVRDPLLIWVIFILLSQNFIKQLIGKYVKQINPNEEGVVSFLGVVIYGLIFAVLFGLIKFLLNMIL
jgi:hypothetical protein